MFTRPDPLFPYTTLARSQRRGVGGAGGVDVAGVGVPAREAGGVIEECGRARVGAAIVTSAGFAEAGPEGRQRQEDVLATARRFGVRILGPNCLGVINTDPDVRLRAPFTGPPPQPGRVGFLSQSGPLGAVLLGHAHEAGPRTRSFTRNHVV